MTFTLRIPRLAIAAAVVMAIAGLIAAACTATWAVITIAKTEPSQGKARSRIEPFP